MAQVMKRVLVVQARGAKGPRPGVMTGPPRQIRATRESGCDMQMIPQLLGRNEVRTTMIYTHVLTGSGSGKQVYLETI